jgi:rod shape determining protein RodA
MSLLLSRDDPTTLSLGDKVLRLNWFIVLVLVGLACIGAAMLYSAANGSMDPWASRHLVRFGAALFVAVIVAMVDIRLWFRLAYWIYAFCLALLIAVEVAGSVGMGAQRWIDLGVIQVQPSELMKVALILGLARHFHTQALEQISRPSSLALPLLMTFIPVALVLRQPDLGTALMLTMVAGAVAFVAGVRLWVFGSVIAAGLAAIPLAWNFLKDYQKNRVLTFLNPERDPLGAGYHIIQSKIALGSGGIHGKGFLQGSQSHLQFLPEKQTDFIFTMFGEEFGLIGALALIGAYVFLIGWGVLVGLRCQNHFGRLIALGVATNIFLYAFINMAMVMGILPVVGVPLPLISYGGTALITVMGGFGLLLGAAVHSDIHIARKGVGEDD